LSTAVTEIHEFLLVFENFGGYRAFGGGARPVFAPENPLFPLPPP
jgi:hypothetical protein